jgi:hypothetical protein
MTTLHPSRPGINPGCGRRPYAPARSIDLHKLEGRERRAWEESIFVNDDLKGSRLHLARVLLEEFCWGKPWCYPGDELLARKVGVGTATISRALRDLVGLGVIRIVKVRGGRRIVFPSHPHASAYLDSIGVPTDPAEVPVPIRPEPGPGPADQSDGRLDQPDGPVHQNDRQSVEENPREEPKNDEDAARSSSSFDPSPEEKTDPSLDRAVAIAGDFVARPAAAVHKILDEMPSIDPGAIATACELAKGKGKGWNYVRGIVANWSTEGRAIPPAPKPKPSRVYYRAAPRTPESVAAGAEAAATWRRIRAQAAADG